MSFSAGWATVVRIPADFPTIQEGIDACTDGDTVLIAPGVYTGEGNFNIDTGGKAILVAGESGAPNTIIDCDVFNHGFIIENSEGSGTVIADLTIRSALMGIICDWTSPIIRSCIIRDFAYDGVRIDGHTGNPAIAPVVEDCIFIQEGVDYVGWGDGVFVYREVEVTISGCKFVECSNGIDFHASANQRPDFTVTNCDFRDNADNAIYVHS
jgi:hypothetical protein